MTETAVFLVDVLGSDISIVNAARVSYKSSSHATEFNADTDAKLLFYLARNKHMSPFRHAAITIYCLAPEFVARQVSFARCAKSYIF